MREIVIGIFIVVSLVSHGQNAEEVLRKNQLAVENELYSTNILCKSYEEGIEGELTEKSSGAYQVTSQGYYHSMGDVTTILEDSVLLVINHKFREISLRKVEEMPKVTPQFDLLELGEEYLEMEMKEDGDRYEIDVNFKGSYSPISKLVVGISKIDFFFESLSIVYPMTTNGYNPIIEIEYSNTQKTNKVHNLRLISTYLEIKNSEARIVNKSLEHYNLKNFLKN